MRILLTLVPAVFLLAVAACAPAGMDPASLNVTVREIVFSVHPDYRTNDNATNTVLDHSSIGLSGNEDNVPNPGETVEGSFLLTNTGFGQANNLAVEISSSCPWVTGLANSSISVWYGDRVSGFRFSITPDAPDGSLADFKVIITCAGFGDSSSITVSFTDTVSYRIKAEAAGARMEFITNPYTVRKGLVTNYNYDNYNPTALIDRTVFDTGDYGTIGNSNGDVNAGETVRLWLKAWNTGTTKAKGVTMRVSCTNSLATLLSGTNLSMGDISRRALASSVWLPSDTNALLLFSVDPAAPPNTVIDFTAAFSDSFGSNWNTGFSVTVCPTNAVLGLDSWYHLITNFSPPQMYRYLYDLTNYSPSNDNDGYLDPGETASIQLLVRNTGFDVSTGNSLRIESSDARLEWMSNTNFVFGDIAPDGSRYVRGYLNNDFRFKILPSVPSGADIPFTVILSSSNGCLTDTMTVRVK